MLRLTLDVQLRNTLIPLILLMHWEQSEDQRHGTHSEVKGRFGQSEKIKGFWEKEDKNR
jgi:hypothetical protein